MLMQTCFNTYARTPSLIERVATDSLILPLPVPLSPLAMELDNVFPLCLTREDTLTKTMNDDTSRVPMRDSFQLVSQVMSILEQGDGESCQSYANERENTPPVGLTRLATLLPGGEGFEELDLKQQSSDVTFIDAVMSPPTVIPNILATGEQSVDQFNQDVSMLPILLRPTPLTRSDTDETISPPSVATHQQAVWNMLGLDVNTGEATPTITEATPTTNTEATPPKPALARQIPTVIYSEKQSMEITDTSRSQPQINVDNSMACNQPKPCLNSQKASTHWKKETLRKASQQKVSFRKLVKVNTTGEAELNAARSSNGGKPVGSKSALSASTSCLKRRKQQRDQIRKNRDKKMWNLRSSTTTAKRSCKRSSKSQVSTTLPVTKNPIRTTREGLTPARFFFETKLDWTPWRSCILPKPVNKYWTSSSMGHSGFINRELFRTSGFDPSSVVRPTMYELAVQTPNSVKKHVVFFKVASTSNLAVPLENFLMHGQPQLSAQVENVINQNCKVFVRRGILNRKIVLPAGTAKIQVTSAQHLRAMTRSAFDYAWVKQRNVRCRRYIVSNALL